MTKSYDAKYEKAARWSNTVADMSLPEAMRAAQFSESDVRSNTVKQRVRRLAQRLRSKADNPNTNPSTPASFIQAGPDPASEVSPLTASSLSTFSSTTTSQKKPPPVLQKIRRTSGQVMKALSNDKKVKENNKRAFKAATKMLDRERKKKKGDSPKKGARKVARLMNEEFGSSVSAKTIC